MKYKYKLVIHTNSYTGNFHRELNAYVFGYRDESGCTLSEKLAQDAERELTTEIVDQLQEDYLTGIHDEYGQNISCLSDYGKGKSATSITVFFDKNPIDFIDIFRNRLKTFPKALADTWEFAQKDVKILRIQLIEETITEQTIYEKKFAIT